jgi:cytochrome c peroxidase
MRKLFATLILFLACLPLLANCQAGREPAATTLDDQLHQTITTAGVTSLPTPATPDPALIALGQALFFDKEISGNRDIACATCHHPDFASADGLPLAVGVGGTGLGSERILGHNRHFIARNTTDLFNRGLDGWHTMFWDGRVEGTPTGGYTTPIGDFLPAELANVLAAQALFPITFRDEMRGGRYSVAGYSIDPGEAIDPGEGTLNGWYDEDIYGQPNELALINNTAGDFPAIWQGIMQRLRSFPGYQALFQAAYPDTPAGEWTIQQTANALAAFQTSAFTLTNSPWDRYLAGDQTALSEDAKEGALLFYGEAGCAACHSGPFLSDQQYHNIAVPQFGPGVGDDAPLDAGRFHATGNPADRFTFRTPPLRNVALTAPYMHNGAYPTLEAAVNHHLRPAAALRSYDANHLLPELQGTLQSHPVTIAAILETLDPQLSRPISLTDRELSQLLAFLQSLTDPAAANLTHLTPPSVPSGLPVNN